MHILKIDYRDSEADKQFSKSLRETGFAVLEYHPISSELIDSIYGEWINFFKSNEKQHYLYKRETQDGYFPPSISEKAKGASIKDIKEFFQYYPWGQYPSTISPNTKVLYQQLTDLASTLLTWLERTLPPSVSNQLSMPLSSMINQSDQTMLRILHYPPLSGTEPVGAVRAAAHEDINLITLLVGATSSGLQVKDNQGRWHEVPCSKEHIVVNAGDMLDLATNGHYRSTTHRVVNPDSNNLARLSMPLFLHPRPEVQLSPEKTARQYLYERLSELGVL
ncbi:2OG-Fe(II) oxygenase family protein [Legionella impletisoli]|uniref:2-oxoglutarate-dependent ethylene/succinate-forming enzyme n=1 Tax=Legionella impletisoli TaxID=343510 RepID=A0A917JS71_9GAMM|nr:2OG-Fe(II) oxygenase family protein [Legionella impletisoli]GGI81294.1 2OG-Fe(II) oxygenase [Legionella impletisoli]